MKKLSDFSKRRLVNIYSLMKQRCYNPRNPGFHNYGGRGIRVCVDWLLDSNSFYTWAVNNGYSDELSIDRIDNNGDYSPANCRWVTVKVQNNNTRTNRLLTYKGKTQTMAQWADEVGINYAALENRINRLKWPLSRALESS